MLPLSNHAPLLLIFIKKCLNNSPLPSFTWNYIYCFEKRERMQEVKLPNIYPKDLLQKQLHKQLSSSTII
jgi:hypothetical protein